ncbi:MAG: hypothetical protein NTX84_09080 [Nitrospirae bacterium]|nr:hypothetical protein [Nitrospirota bacterium]
MKQARIRTAEISREQRRRRGVMQSFQMMLLSGVVRRADRNPPLLRRLPVPVGAEGWKGSNGSVSKIGESGWFARVFFSQGER